MTMPRRGIFVVLATLLLIGACSERGSYQAIRESKAFECQNLPESERARCERQLMPPYDEYERARAEEERK